MSIRLRRKIGGRHHSSSQVGKNNSDALRCSSEAPETAICSRPHTVPPQAIRRGPSVASCTLPFHSVWAG